MSRTEKSLIEQMKITDYEITRRLDLLNLDINILSILSKHRKIIVDNIDIIVTDFYQRQTEIDEISLLIGDAETLNRLRGAQKHYVLDLFAGNYGSEYVNNRLRIGLVHKRIGVEPKLYISAVVTLKECISNVLESILTDKEELKTTLDVLNRLINFDTTLVFDTYIGSLVGEIETAKKRTEIYAQELEIKVALRTKQLEEQAKRDPLTGLFNHRAFQESLHRELSLAKRRKGDLALVYIDVDKFKKLNDLHGHLYGDEILKTIARVFFDKLRQTDIPCRYGGDEFCIILPDCEQSQAQEVCEKIFAELKRCKVACSLSVGIHNFNYDNDMSADEFIHLADQKMYEAKKIEGNSICINMPLKR